MPSRQVGPLTRDQLIELWKSVTDRSYWEPILADDQSRAIIEAIAEMYARASESVDTNTQAMYIKPFSGQTGEPASGERKAEVTLEVRRTRLLHVPLVFQQGISTFQQWLNDWGKEGPQLVTTNRRYVALLDAALAPGETGPLLLTVQAERAGYGYNVPGPGTIQRAVQQAPGLNNVGGSLIPGVSSHEMAASETPDVPIVQHIGSMLEFVGGANKGQIRAIVGFKNPVPGSTGGSVILAADGVFTISGVLGTFAMNEPVIQTPSGASGRVLALANGRIVIRRTTGNFLTTQTITGETSGATAVIGIIDQSPDLIAESGTVQWKVLSWQEAFGLEVTNPESPAGGRSGMLDELGNERNINRLSDETDDEVYRDRVASPADVVSPNAIRRAANRVLKPHCLEVCLREVGRPLFPGLFFDHDFFDYGRVSFTLTGGGAGFIDGEIVQQENAGQYTQGRLSLQDATALIHIDYQKGPGFVNGGTIKGITSGTTDTITSIPVGDPNEKRFNVLLDMFEMRGFFLIGVPAFADEVSGTFYDAQIASNFFDAGSIDNFFDGLDSSGPTAIYAQIWEAVNAARAGGVPFAMYVEEIGCF